MRKETCESCQAFHPANHECRRHAPVMVPVPVQDLTGKQHLRSAGLYPATMADGWCCEYLPDSGVAILQ